MSWAAKRFWSEVATTTEDQGFGVTLDGKPLKTPGKQMLALPTETLAEAVAREWAEVEDVIRPAAMPMTRLANTAIEKVAPIRPAVVDEIAAYGASDLLCYRAEHPAELALRQAANWDPLLGWAGDALGARLVATQGIIHKKQDRTALARLRAEIDRHDAFALTALYEMTAISGSLIIALAAIHCHDPETLWRAARTDEDWQAEHWGHDEEAEESAALKKADFLSALRFHALISA